MAEEIEMTPVDAAEPPKANPLAKPIVANKVPTLKASPLARPGLKLPSKPGLSTAGLKLPPKPIIRKPGATVSSALPKPIMPTKPAAVPVDAQGVGKLPTVAAAPASRTAAPVEAPKPVETLKSVTQKLKGITQQIPQQAILHKTGIIADAALTEAQKEAAKHKTARISLSDAMGVAPVKNENAPMKTIRIKRPINIPGATEKLAPQPAEAVAPAAEPAVSVTQKKTLKIARPATSKFAVKRPAPAGEGEVADIPDIPSAPIPPVPTALNVDTTPAWVYTLSTIVQLAACVVMGVVAWYLYQNTQTFYF